MPRLAARPGDLVLVTGATGRIGANLCRALRSRDYRLRAVALPGDPAIAKLDGLDVDVVEADLRDEAAVVAACEGVDAICHLAALMGPDAGDMPVSEYWHLNVDATLHVLEGARKNGRLVKLVFSSTDATYPAVNPRYSPIDENHVQDPVNLYGLTKVAGERLCLDYLTEFQVPAAIVRYGGVGSPDERATGRTLRLSSQLQRFHDSKVSHNNYLWITVTEHERPWEYLEPLVADNDPLIALTDLEGRAWISHPTDVRDAVQGTVLALESEAAVGEAFNILGPSPVSSTEAARYLSERLDVPWQHAPVPFRQAYEMSTAKARAVLGYRPQIDFFRAVDDGLAMLRGDDIGIVPAKLAASR
ncbi:MAG: NAD(P)-dependent oxidoreductase [Chloroflexi bacterium]|nr:NAD(P)-dependent oxidoreductase [Chloroflexota bacterium]